MKEYGNCHVNCSQYVLYYLTVLTDEFVSMISTSSVRKYSVHYIIRTPWGHRIGNSHCFDPLS